MALFFVVSPTNAADLTRIMVAQVSYDTSDVLLSADKIEVGVGLAFQLTNGYSVLPTLVRDSVLVKRGLTNLSVVQAAEELNADELLYVTVRRLENLVRTEVVVISGSGFNTKKRGVGYAAIRFHNDSTDVPVADPALLLSAQRAVMACTGNHELYINADTLFRALPAPVIVIGGIDFVLNADTSKTPAWNIFKEQEVTSYDAVQTIAEVFSSVDSVTLVDIETRDTMLARANLMMVTNNHATTLNELRVFYAFGISWVISGTCTFTAEAYRLQLSVAALEKDTTRTLSTVERSFTVDSKKNWQESVLEVSKMLVASLPTYR